MVLCNVGLGANGDGPRRARNGHPHLNAQALISMNSALDALVEEFVPAMREIRVQWLTDRLPSATEEKRAGDRGNKHEGHFRREKQNGPAYVLIRPISFNRAQSARR